MLALWMVIQGMSFPVSCFGSEIDGPPFQIILVVSKNIRPYVEAVDGFRDRIERSADVKVDVIVLDRYEGKARIDLAEGISKENKTDLLVAIGPEAAAFAWEELHKPGLLKIYSIILNPEKIIGNLESVNGISLNIPPVEQLKIISKGLASVRRIGIFFDPANNSDFFAALSAAELEMDIDLVPLSVSSKKDIPFLLQECWDSIDVIWLIPDRTVISESIAQYIIKEAVLKKIPVIGYNQFFYDSGAAMAFVFDYTDLGRQTAELAEKILSQSEKSVAWSPVFQVWLNETVLGKMKIKIPEPLEFPLMVGP